MSEKKYYWLKLQKDFFKRSDIQIVEAMKNGKDYILFYLKLLVESVSFEGELRFSETIPYNDEMLSVITNTNIDIVRSAMNVFESLKMITVLEDKTIYMNEIEMMIGKSCMSDDEKRNNAERQKRFRERKKQALLEDNNDSNVTVTLNVTESKSKSIELDKDIDIEKEKDLILSKESICRTDVQRIVDAWNNLSSLGIKSVVKIASSTKRAERLRARIKQYSVNEILDAIENIKTSDFLLGKNKDGWTITFDWFVKPNNFPKVLEGNYNNANRQAVKNDSTNYIRNDGSIDWSKV